MNAIDLDKQRRELLRWHILLVLNVARPIGASEDLILAAVNDMKAQVTQHELRRELDYLEERELLKITGKGTAAGWHAELTRTGIDVAEYTVECDPGIARPKKYF